MKNKRTGKKERKQPNTPTNENGRKNDRSKTQTGRQTGFFSEIT
jgi:hypothetical protein